MIPRPIREDFRFKRKRYKMSWYDYALAQEKYINKLEKELEDMKESLDMFCEQQGWKDYSEFKAAVETMTNKVINKDE